MTVVVFFLLALIVAGAIAYPLLPGRTPPPPTPVVTDEEIERAVRTLRRERAVGGLSCPSCGQAYQAGDRFCVRCGGELTQAVAVGPVCPSCGSAVHEGDRFCAKCGHSMAVGEAG